jgi:hypothetical protein
VQTKDARHERMPKALAVSGATKKSALCGLTLELRRRAVQWVIATTHHGRLERIVRPHPMHDLG